MRAGGESFALTGRMGGRPSSFKHSPGQLGLPYALRLNIRSESASGRASVCRGRKRGCVRAAKQTALLYKIKKGKL